MSAAAARRSQRADARLERIITAVLARAPHSTDADPEPVDAGCHLIDADLDWPAWQAAQRARTEAQFAEDYAAGDAAAAKKTKRKPTRSGKAAWGASMAQHGTAESMQRGAKVGAKKKRRAATAAQRAAKDRQLGPAKRSA